MGQVSKSLGELQTREIQDISCKTLLLDSAPYLMRRGGMGLSLRRGGQALCLYCFEFANRSLPLNTIHTSKLPLKCCPHGDVTKMWETGRGRASGHPTSSLPNHTEVPRHSPMMFLQFHHNVILELLQKGHPNARQKVGIWAHST